MAAPGIAVARQTADSGGRVAAPSLHSSGSAGGIADRGLHPPYQASRPKRSLLGRRKPPPTRYRQVSQNPSAKVFLPPLRRY